MRADVIRTKFITSPQTWPLRRQVLKPFLTEPECANPGDDDKLTFHIGAFDGDHLVAIATFLQEDAPTKQLALVANSTSVFSNYRLRGMACDFNYHGKGFAKAALLAGEVELQKRDADLLWFNAREQAFGFYQKLGYKFHGDYFDLPKIGPHKVMYKYLKGR